MYNRVTRRVSYMAKSIDSDSATRTYSISEIREEITHLPEQFDENLETVTVTHHGKPIMTILPTSTYKELLETIDSLLETIEVLKDKELMASIHRGMKDIEEGRVEPL